MSLGISMQTDSMSVLGKQVRNSNDRDIREHVAKVK